MLKHLYIILIATFIFGFVTGSVLYLRNNTGNEGDGGLAVDSRGFTITAYMYGGCAMGGGCPSYRLSDNGSYMYILRGEQEGDRRFEEELSGTQRNMLKMLVSETDFNALYDTEYTGTCPIAFDGTAYQYDIEYEGERFEFDSCIEMLETEKLFKALQDYFKIFAITHGTI